MKANDLPLSFVIELTSLTARLVGELAADYGIKHSPENASKVGMLLVNVGITMMTLRSDSTTENIKKEICELIDAVDIKKLQDMFDDFGKRAAQTESSSVVQLADRKVSTDKKNIN